MRYPAVVLLDPNGGEIFRYVGNSNSDRHTFEDLSKNLQELKNH